MSDMKTILVSAVFICLLDFSANAQTQQKAKSNPSKTNSTKTVTKGKLNSTKTSELNSVSLSATSSHNAKTTVGSMSSTNTYTISDPTLLTLNARANGSTTPISKSGIVGMPKRAYGFDNGHVLLYSTGATSSGTITGTGVVGTGSSLGNIGSYGPAIGLNGKSPYAGSTMWGNATGMQPAHADSAVRITAKKQ
jgi:hypothetical protein